MPNLAGNVLYQGTFAVNKSVADAYFEQLLGLFGQLIRDSLSQNLGGVKDHLAPIQ